MQGTFELRIQPQNATETLFILFNSRTGELWVSKELSAETLWQRVPRPWETQLSDDKVETSTINDAERIMIVRMLREVGGNKLEAAKRLGIGRQTLYNKIETYQIGDDELLS